MLRQGNQGVCRQAGQGVCEDAVQGARGAQPTPHTVTQVPGVGSFARPPIRRSRRLDVHTRSHTKLGSVLSSSLPHSAAQALCKRALTNALVGACAATMPAATFTGALQIVLKSALAI